MRFVIFGLSVSSAWGNGHATLWRSLIRALDRAGHVVVFYERDVPYYAAHRDVAELPGRSRLRLYAAWDEIRVEARRVADASDVAIVTSYCADGRAAADVVLGSRAAARVFYDLDTPVTLTRLLAGADVPYLPEDGLGGFDLVLSFAGGPAVTSLRERLGARRVETLYGSVDPDTHRPVAPAPAWAADASYLGTWSADREDALDRLLLEPARRRPGARFVVAGSLYPAARAWPANVAKHDHVPPSAHPAFYASSPVTINVTRAAIAAMGWCPSGRLFEAAACGVPVLSDAWDGLDRFFTPGDELLIARSADDAVAALALGRDELARIGARARARALDEHAGARRAAELVAHVERRAGGEARP